MAIYIEEIISEKTENQNELYFLIIWNSTAGGVPVRQEVQFFYFQKGSNISKQPSNTIFDSINKKYLPK